MPDQTLNRRHRLFKNSLYGLFSWLFPIIPTIFATPILVKGLGKEQYGLYVIISGFISYFFTAGIGKAAAKYVAEYRATGETERIPDIISSTIILSLSLGLFVTGLVLIFSRTIVADVLLIPPEFQDKAVIALYLACATVLIGAYGLIFQYVLQGLQRFDRFLILTNLSSFLLGLGSIIAVLLGYGVLTILALTLFVAAMTCFLSFWMAKKLLPELRFNLRLSREAWRLVWRYALSILSYAVFGNILLLFERGWITRKFGASALSYYVVPMTLAMYIHMFIGSLVLAFFPAVNELLTEPEKLATLYQKTTKIIFALVAFAVVSAVVCGRLFLGLWLDNEFANISYPLLVIHVLTFTILAMATIVWQVAESFRAASLNAIAAFIWMLVSIPLMVLLSEPWQTEGVALARLAGALIFIPLVLYVEKRFLGGVLWKFWGSVAFRIICGGLFAYLVEWAIVTQFPNMWLTFVSAVVSGFLVYAMVLLFTGFLEADEKLLIRNAILK